MSVFSDDPIKIPKSPSEQAKRSYSSFLPLLLILLALNLETIRDIINLNKHRATTYTLNAQAVERLKKTTQEAAFVDEMKKNLTRLGTTDPIVARIVAEFFPAPPTPPTPSPSPSSSSTIKPSTTVTAPTTNSEPAPDSDLPSFGPKSPPDNPGK